MTNTIEPLVNIEHYVKRLNSYLQEHYPANKKITSEEWNALFLALIKQGNLQEEILEKICNNYLPLQITKINALVEATNNHEEYINNLRLDVNKALDDSKLAINNANEALSKVVQSTGTSTYINKALVSELYYTSDPQNQLDTLFNDIELFKKDFEGAITDLTQDIHNEAIARSDSDNNILNSIPTKISQFENDLEYITNNELVFNLEQLINTKGFITNTVNDLVNYYPKTETYNQTEVDNLVANVATTDTEQTIIAKKIFDNIIQLNKYITSKDGMSLLSQTDSTNILGHSSRLLAFNALLRPIVKFWEEDVLVSKDMAFTSDIPVFSKERDPEDPGEPETPSEKFQASYKLGEFTIKFGVDYLNPKKDSVTTKTINFKEPFKRYCAGVVTGLSSASTLRTTNLSDSAQTTGLTVAIYRTNDTATYFSWIAVGI